jgi:hypothetical protein
MIFPFCFVTLGAHTDRLSQVQGPVDRRTQRHASFVLSPQGQCGDSTTVEALEQRMQPVL